MKMEASTTPSSSSNHVVLERLNGVKTGVDKKMETGDLPSIGDDDIHNVIGSCKTFIKFIVMWSLLTLFCCPCSRLSW